MKKFGIFLGTVLLIAIIGIIGVFSWYNISLNPLKKPTGNEEKEVIRIEIKEGMVMRKGIGSSVRLQIF